MRLRATAISTGILVVSLCAVFTAHADILWDQGPGTSAGAWAAYTNAPLAEKVADNFSLMEGSMITDVEWWAVTLYPDTYYSIGSLRLSNVAGYEIEFYADSGGVGSLIASETVPITSIDVTVENAFLANMRVSLSSPVPLAAGSYWIAINAVTADPAGPVMAWAWRVPSSPEGDNILAFDDGADGTWGPPTRWRRDTSFRIGSSVIPAPDATMLGVAGLACVGFLRRRVNGQ